MTVEDFIRMIPPVYEVNIKHHVYPQQKLEGNDRFTFILTTPLKESFETSITVEALEQCKASSVEEFFKQVFNPITNDGK